MGRICHMLFCTGCPIYTAGWAAGSNTLSLIIGLICFHSAALTAPGSYYGTERLKDTVCMCVCVCVCTCASKSVTEKKKGWAGLTVFCFQMDMKNIFCFSIEKKVFSYSKVVKCCIHYLLDVWLGYTRLQYFWLLLHCVWELYTQPVCWDLREGTELRKVIFLIQWRFK